MEFDVSMLLRPEIERDGGEFVDERIGEPVLGEVDGFDVGVAGVAALHANVGQLGGGVDRKPDRVFLSTSGTDKAAKLPLREAESAEQAAPAAVALLAEYADRWFPIAEWAE